MKRWSVAALGLVLIGSASSAWADPLVQLFLLGRAAGSSDPFSRTVAVAPGQTVEYEVIGQMAPIGTSNTNGYTHTPHTITSLTASTLTSGDGIQSLVLDLFQLPTDPIQVDISPVQLNTDP